MARGSFDHLRSSQDGSDEGLVRTRSSSVSSMVSASPSIPPSGTNTPALCRPLLRRRSSSHAGNLRHVSDENIPQLQSSLRKAQGWLSGKTTFTPRHRTSSSGSQTGSQPQQEPLTTSEAATMQSSRPPGPRRTVSHEVHEREQSLRQELNRLRDQVRDQEERKQEEMRTVEFAINRIAETQMNHMRVQQVLLDKVAALDLQAKEAKQEMRQAKKESKRLRRSTGSGSAEGGEGQSASSEQSSPPTTTDAGELSIYEAYEYEYLYPFCPCDKCNRDELFESDYDDREAEAAAAEAREYEIRHIMEHNTATFALHHTQTYNYFKKMSFNNHEHSRVHFVSPKASLATLESYHTADMHQTEGTADVEDLIEELEVTEDTLQEKHEKEEEEKARENEDREMDAMIKAFEEHTHDCGPRSHQRQTPASMLATASSKQPGGKVYHSSEVDAIVLKNNTALNARIAALEKRVDDLTSELEETSKDVRDQDLRRHVVLLGNRMRWLERVIERTFEVDAPRTPRASGASDEAFERHFGANGEADMRL